MITRRPSQCRVWEKELFFNIDWLFFIYYSLVNGCKCIIHSMIGFTEWLYSRPLTLPPQTKTCAWTRTSKGRDQNVRNVKGPKTPLLSYSVDIEKVLIE